MNNYHAIILNGRLDAHDRIWGNVYNDKKGRFKDGELITTSNLLDPPRPGKPIDGNWRTKNTVYFVHWAK